MGELRERDSIEHCRLEEVLLIGHSRGMKISALESLFDERVKCLALVDPVDNTQYAPLDLVFPQRSWEWRATIEKKKFGPLSKR